MSRTKRARPIGLALPDASRRAALRAAVTMTVLSLARQREPCRDAGNSIGVVAIIVLLFPELSQGLGTLNPT